MNIQTSLTETGVMVMFGCARVGHFCTFFKKKASKHEMGYKETGRRRSRSRSPPSSDRYHQHYRGGYNNSSRYPYASSSSSSGSYHSDRKRYNREEYENFDNRDYKRSRKEESVCTFLFFLEFNALKVHHSSI